MSEPFLKILATALIVIGAIPERALSATYYDCVQPDGTKTYRAEPCYKGETEAKHFVPPPSQYDDSQKDSVSNNGPRSIYLLPVRQGNFLVSGSINGRPVEFMVDTGASIVSVSAQQAAAYGLNGCATGKFATANGIVNGCIATAATLTIEGYRVHNVAVSIMPNLAGPPLLGMNVLSQFKIEQVNGAMRLSK